MLNYAVGTFLFTHIFTHKMSELDGHMMATGIEGSMKILCLLLAACLLVMLIRI